MRVEEGGAGGDVMSYALGQDDLTQLRNLSFYFRNIPGFYLEAEISGFMGLILPSKKLSFALVFFFFFKDFEFVTNIYKQDRM